MISQLSKEREDSAVILHESGEDYLEAILILRERNRDVHSIDIANQLGYSKPSVSIAMKKLRENGYITVEEGGHIALTESGEAAAIRVYTRHKVLTELFMMMGVSHETAALDACKVEHDLSEETFDCIRSYLESVN